MVTTDTGDQKKCEPVIPSAVQRLFFPDQVQDAPQTRGLVVRTEVGAANKILDPRRVLDLIRDEDCCGASGMTELDVRYICAAV